jgi:hypothetical protein
VLQKRVNRLCGQNAYFLDVKADGTYSVLETVRNHITLFSHVQILLRERREEETGKPRTNLRVCKLRNAVEISGWNERQPELLSDCNVSRRSVLSDAGDVACRQRERETERRVCRPAENCARRCAFMRPCRMERTGRVHDTSIRATGGLGL